MTAYANAASTAPASTALLRTLVLCDLADSTALTERLGDRDAADLFRRHDRLVRDLLPQHAGREIDKTDGFLLVFERPVQAVAFALAYQRQLAELAARKNLPLTARVGVHFGDVVVWENERDDIERGAKPTEVEGLVKPVTARLAQLALPGQILLSGTAYDIAHRAQGELGAQLGSVRWLAHGRYRFKGVPDPVPVFEVGEEGIAPLKPPPWSSKAHREVPFWRRPAMLGAELTLLAIAIAVPAIYLLRPAPAIAFANRDWVVVGDLKNLTGESRFDESLQTAFRIGLEQSRYVNVLSDLKARETIKLMQRDPDQTPIDRTVGAEIALRDSARALILPTIAEIGGRVRVTVEVVDPKSQATVYSETADGVGESSVLNSFDRVNRQLRSRLGEAVASITNESRPLEQVATKNLDALRAYTLGRAAYDKNEMEEATRMFEQALKLDPGFALARLALGRIDTTLGHSADAIREFDAAMALRENLSPRDALFVEAMHGTYGESREALVKWRTLTTLYPDFFSGQAAYAYFNWQLANRFDEPIENTKLSLSPRDAYHAASQYLLGVLYLGTERYADALTQFREVNAVPGTPLTLHVAAHAAQRNFAQVDALLAKMPAESRSDPVVMRLRAAFAMDRGRWKEATDILDAVPASEGIAPADRHVLALSRFALLSLAGKSAELSHSGREILGRLRDLPTGSGIEQSQKRFCILALSYLSARIDDLDLARAAFAAVGAKAAVDPGYPVVAAMGAMAKAEMLRAEKHPEDAIAVLTQQGDNELYLTHAALMDAYLSAGQASKAIEQADWLAVHRGRAYAEYGFDWTMTPFNIAQSNLALLRKAQMARGSAQGDLARSSLRAFIAAWPEAKHLPFIKPDALQESN